MKKQKDFFRTISVISGLLFFACICEVKAQTPDGFAAGTTGGAGGSSVTVTSAAAFKSAAESSSSMIITVSGSLNLGADQVNVKSNKTITGANSSATLTGCLRLSGVSNVIVKNLNISNLAGVGTGDGMEISGSTKVFVTKCTFTDCADGELDIVRASDYVTVSWCRFRYVNQTTHKNVNLIGNSDDATGDRGKLHVTMHHNWYDAGCLERMPRVRFGQVHCYNNYLGASGSNYCVGVGNESQILVENCYFDNQGSAWKNYSSSSSTQGRIEWRNLCMVNNTTPTWAPNSDVFNPPYSYSMDAPCNVKSIVMSGAGNGGSTPNNPPSVSITSPSNGASFTAPASITINANASDTDGTISNVQFYQGTTLLGTDTSSPYSFTWSNVAAGSYSLTAKATDNIGATATSSVVTITVTGGTTPTTITIQENQTGFCSFNGTIDNDNAGFTGAGFVNTPNSTGQGITWSVSVPSNGTYSLVWRYANGTTTNRTAQVMVNGVVVVSSIGFLGTGSWTTWTSTPSTNITLTAGTKLIRLEATNSSGLANIDYIAVTGSSPQPVSCTGQARIAGHRETSVNPELSESEFESALELYPVPSNGLLNIKLHQEFSTGAVIQLLDNTGKVISNTQAKGTAHTLDLNELPAGLYLVKVSNARKRIIRRISKE